MTITLYLRILAGDREEWERKGWKFVGEVFPLGGWEQCLVKKDVKS